MRKVFFCTAVILVVGSLQAQFKPTSGTFGLEIQFRPLGNNLFETVHKPTLNGVNMFGVSARYFCIDRLELRGDLLFGINSNKNKQTDPLVSSETQTTKVSESLFGLNLGANYHFKGTERISPYVGAVIGFGFSNLSRNITNWNYAAGDYSKEKQKGIYLDFAAVTGFNWYIVDGLYLGAEIGLGLEFAKPLKNTTKTKIGGTESKITVDPTQSAFNFNFYANPAIRLGWKF
jgi:outer membrane protein W